MNFQFTYESIIRYLQIAVDIAVVWLLINYIIKVAKSSQKTIQLFQGIILILAIQAIAKFLGLTTVAIITDNIVSWGFLAIIVVFQPEVRSVLERLGKSNALARISVLSRNEKEKLVDELVAATANLSSSQTGALITLEQSQFLNEYVNTGVKLNSVVSAELLCSIFQTTTPLHDGAVIIQGDRIACASAYFPPTTMDLPSRYGARHRAAIGISEVTDAITIVVSEETGRVALTRDGKILQMNEHKLRNYLEKIILDKEVVKGSSTAVTSASSVSVENLVSDNTDNSEDEIEFKVDDSHENEKLMKTFQSTDFKADLEKEDRTLFRKKPESNPVVKQLVNDIANERKQETAELNSNQPLPEIKIKKISVPRDTITESHEIENFDVEEVFETIKTQRIVEGNEESDVKGGKDNG
ncbi:MAG: diadenylate cyclase CdaA [Erysipelotrichaceae bacterium]|nr:diadenylate cyclase CdaA [Erysipelotrichaceae bacterium]